jgi:hypothetical protein
VRHQQPQGAYASYPTDAYGRRNGRNDVIILRRQKTEERSLRILKIDYLCPYEISLFHRGIFFDVDGGVSPPRRDGMYAVSTT